MKTFGLSYPRLLNGSTGYDLTSGLVKPELFIPSLQKHEALDGALQVKLKGHKHKWIVVLDKDAVLPVLVGWVGATMLYFPHVVDNPTLSYSVKLLSAKIVYKNQNYSHPVQTLELETVGYVSVDGEVDIVDDVVIPDVPTPTVVNVNIIDDSSNSGIGGVLFSNTCTGLPEHYMISDRADFAGATWEPYLTSFVLHLKKSGVNTYYFKVKRYDKVSNTMSCSYPAIQTCWIQQDNPVDAVAGDHWIHTTEA